MKTVQDCRILHSLYLLRLMLYPIGFFVNGTLQYRAERMRGTGYKHYNHCWSGDVTAMLRHWNFALLVQYRKDQVSLWGESLTWGETFQSCS